MKGPYNELSEIYVKGPYNELSEIYVKGPYNELSEIYDFYIQIPYVNFKIGPQTGDLK